MEQLNNLSAGFEELKQDINFGENQLAAAQEELKKGHKHRRRQTGRPSRRNKGK
jgi:hypothetical protein